MNYLAHIYLSGDNKEVLIGNFIADGIKGKDYKTYPSQIKKGILLHRGIDSFTDQHSTVRRSTKKLHKNYGHYSGVIVDILYDHFLAKNWANYHERPLYEYVQDFYGLLESVFEELPSKIQMMMPYMIRDNWLYSYRTIPGIAKILEQMTRRIKHKVDIHLAVGELNEYYSEFEDEFTSFFSELKNFSSQKLLSLESE